MLLVRCKLLQSEKLISEIAKMMNRKVNTRSEALRVSRWMKNETFCPRFEAYKKRITEQLIEFRSSIYQLNTVGPGMANDFPISQKVARPTYWNVRLNSRTELRK